MALALHQTHLSLSVSEGVIRFPVFKGFAGTRASPLPEGVFALDQGQACLQTEHPETFHWVCDMVALLLS